MVTKPNIKEMIDKECLKTNHIEDTISQGFCLTRNRFENRGEPRNINIISLERNQKTLLSFTFLILCCFKLIRYGARISMDKRLNNEAYFNRNIQRK